MKEEFNFITADEARLISSDITSIAAQNALKELDTLIRSAAFKGVFSLDVTEKYRIPKCVFLHLESLGYRVKKVHDENNRILKIFIEWELQ